MRINFIKPIQISNKTSFGYKSILKDEFLKGNLPTVKKDMGGFKLTKNNVTNGHMLPHSQGGKTILPNLMLETVEYNYMKQADPFSKFFNKEGFEAYCAQFKGIKLPKLDGDRYVKDITETAERLLKNGL